ncbi:MAG: tetratricopeptide repeat protein [Chloroflexi bacterium]|nr:tetratricopeptide repeat protein [Chloroflexota bacterium]
MPLLEIRLLGSPQLILNGKPINSLPAKAQALLCYLAVTRQQFPREYLAELLWSDEKMRPQKKLSNLRGAGGLNGLTKCGLDKFLVIRRHSLAFLTESDYWLDVAEFESILQTSDPTLPQLQKAADLYQGEFVTGLSVRHAAGFEEWVQVYRERLRHLILNALYMLTVHYKQNRHYTAGVSSVTRLLALEPYFEEAHRELMLLLALTGQVSEACTHYEQYWDMLDAEGLEPEPETKSLYQKLLRNEIEPDEVALPPLESSSPQWTPPPFQAPSQTRHFIGRQQILTELEERLQQSPRTAVQALVGMGGVGKSALAVEIAHAVQDDFADGVLWATVATSEPLAILESWAQAYGYDFSRIGDLESMANAFRGVLAEKQVLMVLDDVMSVTRIRPLLPNGPGVQVLITTRDQDLAYALDAAVWPLAELSATNGRLLLTRILGEERIQAESAAADEIGVLLQQLPLAVEIVAQRLKSRPRRKLADVARRLRDEDRRLSELKISDRAVRASFGLSYATLDAGLRRLFALLGLFGGRSFTAVPLAAVAELDRYEAEDRIFALVALSLAQEDGEVRYKQHPLLADFAREKLAEEGDREGVYGRFARHYLTFAQQQQHDYDALRPEWDNLMAAMETAYDHELWPVVIDFADVLHDAWFNRSRYTQARQGYEWTYKASLTLKDEVSLAKCLLNWGEACIEQNDYEEATQHLNDGLTAQVQMNNLEGIATVNYHLSRIALEQGKYDEAKQLLDASLLIRERLHDRPGLSNIYYRQALIHYENESIDNAVKLAQSALSIQKSMTDKRFMVKTLRLLAQLAMKQKEIELANEYAEQAHHLSEELQDRGELVATLYTLSGIFRLERNFDKARIHAEEAIKLSQQQGLRRFEALAKLDMSRIFIETKAYDLAMEMALSCLEILEELRDYLYSGYTILILGDLNKKLDNDKEAAKYWKEAMSIAKNLNHSGLIKKVEDRFDSDKAYK